LIGLLPCLKFKSTNTKLISFISMSYARLQLILAF